MKRKKWTRQCLLQPLVMYQLSLRLGVSYEAVAWSLVRYKVFTPFDIQRLLRTKPVDIKKSILGKDPADSRKKSGSLMTSTRTRSSNLAPMIRSSCA